MPIHPLPQFEADLAEDRAAYERLRPPTTVVVRFGTARMIGEFAYDGGVTPGCGSRMVVRTARGTELGEMLTTTCPNSGCGKSVSRQEMLRYIENSGGRDYPFFSEGRVVRIATAEDLHRQAQLDESRPELLRSARRHVDEMGLPMRVVDAEPILGGERITFYFTSEKRVDFRELVTRLATDHRTRIELRQVGARDEARLIADYERCGQHCCCRQFLKVLKPVSMRSAKVQKATLDPLKISGRCGRLMCCLRYEEQTYDELRARLPRKKTPVVTPDGPGLVVDTQILTQLVLVRLTGSDREVAVPLEELVIGAGATPPSGAPDDADMPEGDPDGEASPGAPAAKGPGAPRPATPGAPGRSPAAHPADAARRARERGGARPPSGPAPASSKGPPPAADRAAPPGGGGRAGGAGGGSGQPARGAGGGGAGKGKGGGGGGGGAQAPRGERPRPARPDGRGPDGGPSAGPRGSARSAPPDAPRPPVPPKPPDGTRPPGPAATPPSAPDDPGAA